MAARAGGKRAFTAARRLNSTHFSQAARNPQQGIGVCRSAIKEASGAGCVSLRCRHLSAPFRTLHSVTQRISDPKVRLSLFEMSRRWLRLAELSEAQQPAVAIAETDRAETTR